MVLFSLVTPAVHLSPLSTDTCQAFYRENALSFFMFAIWHRCSISIFYNASCNMQ